MTERPYETSVPDELAVGPTSPAVASGGYTEGSTSLSEGMADGGAAGVTGEASAQAKSVASDAKASGQQVAQTAASGASAVASEATKQARDLYAQLRGELDEQASTQGRRAAQGVRSLADELRQMASSSEQQGIAGQAVGQVADRAHSVADWLENRQPAEMLDELRSLARRRPGAFLLGAAVLGVVGGRMTRGLTADNGSGGSAGSNGSASSNGSARPGADYDGAATGTIPPSQSPVRSEPYTVGAGNGDTGALTSMTGGVTADPLEDRTVLEDPMDSVDPIDEAFPENRGGVR